jgi:F420-non-reducing hydrogenase large subunit
MVQRITIDPITRLEGHGKIEIFLDDAGNVSLLPGAGAPRL